MDTTKYLAILIFCTIFCISVANGVEDDFKDDYSDYNENIYKKYLEMDMHLKRMAEERVKQVLPYILEANNHVNISSSCSTNLFELITGLRKLSGWSLNFLDSMGKLQSGALTGNVQMFGEYEECVETKVIKMGKVHFEGQYCSVSCKLHLPKVKKIPGVNGRLEGLINATSNSSDLMKQIVLNAPLFYAGKIRIGLCVPSGCTKEDISKIANYSLGEFLNTTVTHCLKKGDLFYWNSSRIFITCIFASLGTIVIVSTVLDNTLESWKNKKMDLKSKVFQCFSLTQNFPKLINSKVSENSITCVHGIRVLTIFWVILGHEFYFHARSMSANHGLNYMKMLSNFFSQIVLNGFICVDVFFFISGFVNSYSRMLIKQDGRSQPGFLKIIAHRLWRIYPAFFAAFCIMVLLFVPQAHQYNTDIESASRCKKNWWRSFLLISNFYNPFEMCMAQTWYLCVDMQLFLLSLLTVPVLLKKEKQGIILHGAIIVIVNLCTMSWWFLDYISPATLDGTRLDKSESVKSYRIYILPFVHVGSYFIGIIVGYIIATKKEFKITKVAQIVGWLVASFFFISMLFMTLRWNSGIPYTRLESALYGAWSRTIFVLGFSWLVFCCVTGRAGLINYILSLKLWIPLSRTTYMIYLISPFVQAHYTGHLSFPADFSAVSIIWTYFGNLCISVLMSFALVLIVESPVIALEKILFRRDEGESKPPAPSEVPKELNTINGNGNAYQPNGTLTTVHI